MKSFFWKRFSFSVFLPFSSYQLLTSLNFFNVIKSSSFMASIEAHDRSTMAINGKAIGCIRPQRKHPFSHRVVEKIEDWKRLFSYAYAYDATPTALISATHLFQESMRYRRGLLKAPATTYEAKWRKLMKNPNNVNQVLRKRGFNNRTKFERWSACNITAIAAPSVGPILQSSRSFRMTRCAMEAASCHNLKPMLILRSRISSWNWKRLYAFFHHTSHFQSQTCCMSHVKISSQQTKRFKSGLFRIILRDKMHFHAISNTVAYWKLHGNFCGWNHKTLEACMGTQLFHAVRCGCMLLLGQTLWLHGSKTVRPSWPIWAVSCSILTWHAAGKFSLSTKAHKGTAFQPNSC